MGAAIVLKRAGRNGTEGSGCCDTSAEIEDGQSKNREGRELLAGNLLDGYQGEGFRRQTACVMFKIPNL